MAKRKRRSQNPQLFLADDDATASAKRRSKAPRHRLMKDNMISSGMSSKILKEALLQRKEIEEEASGWEVNNALGSFDEKLIMHGEEEEEEEEDFDGFSETQSQFGDYEEEIDEEDEKLIEAFLSKDAGPQRTLADIIIQRIKENDAKVTSATRVPLPKLDDSLIDVYKGVGKALTKYTAEKMPKAFNHIPSNELWEELLYLTEPENWSPKAMFHATKIFSSNLPEKKAERFYKLVLLPCVRDHILKHKRLHSYLYKSLKKALFKLGAFYQGILFPLCKSGTCNLREAKIIGSVLKKVSISSRKPYSSAALMKLAEMEYCGTTSYFIKLLLEKKLELTHRVVDTLVAHFMRFLEDKRIMPVIWHQSLLAFVQRYKNELRREDKVNLRILLEKKKHKLITPEVIRELDNSCNRGENEDDLMLLASPPLSVIIKSIEEDRFDIPDVPMEED